MKIHEGLLRCALIALALASIGCEDDDQVEDPTSGCPASVGVSISTGTTVVISWTPNCKLNQVFIGPAEWSIWVPGKNIIAPPVSYGVIPEGASLSLGPGELIPGREYHVRLYRWVGPSDTDGDLVGFATFVR